MSEDTATDGPEAVLAVQCIWCDVPANQPCVRLNTTELRDAPHATRVKSAALVAQARADGAAEERERIRVKVQYGHELAVQNWHIEPEYDRGRAHMADDVWRMLDGPS